MTAKPKRSASPRDVARFVLMRVRRDKAYANLALSAILDQATREISDRRLITELVYGVLRHQRLLDHVLAQHAHRPLSKLDPDTLDTLRMATYQMVLLDRIPGYAAANDAVEAIRNSRGETMARVANAILRKITPHDLQRQLPEEPVLRLAIQFSLPTPLAKHWVKELGLEEATDLARFLCERAPLTIRVNTLQADKETAQAYLEREGARCYPGHVSRDALQLNDVSTPFLQSSYLQGLWTPQDEAAQLVSEVLHPESGDKILDACAGVGGKSTHLAALMENRGEIIAADQSERKLELLREHCMRLKVSCIKSMNADLLNSSAVQGMTVDKVLLDAPCSGLGVLRRHPELKWRFKTIIAQDLVRIQRQLLTNLVGILRPGGVLVYSVCTLTRAEG